MNLNPALPGAVTQKYESTIALYRLRYPTIITKLEDTNFDIRSVFPKVDWSAVIERHPEDCSYAIEERTEY